MKAIDFMPLARETEELRPHLDEAYGRVMNSGFFILGPELEAFETEFAAFCNAKHTVGVGNGLEALRLALLAKDIGPEDEVIVPAFTFIATWLAVSETGAKIVPVDVQTDTANMNTAQLEQAISPKTKAVIPVHLYGQPADMEPVMDLAERHKLFVLEDAAQAHGAEYHGKKCGSLGHAAAFSFYPAKNLGTYGDGGAIVTNDADLAQKIRMLRNYGSSEKYIHNIKGANSRLDELQAAFLREKLKYLKKFTNRRRNIADLYNENLQTACTGVKLPTVKEGRTHAWHLYTIRLEKRDKAREHLQKQGIKTQIHYPVTPALQQAYKFLGFKNGDFPVAESIAKTTLSLPMHSHLNEGEIKTVCNAVKKVLDSSLG